MSLCDECFDDDPTVETAVIFHHETGHTEYAHLCNFCVDQIFGAHRLDDEELEWLDGAEVEPVQAPEYTDEDRELMVSLHDRGRNLSEIAQFYAAPVDVIREQLAIAWDLGVSLPQGHPFRAAA